MRYFVEVTKEQAEDMERSGWATVSSGASGNADNPRFYGESGPWTLMISTELRSLTQPSESATL